MHPIRITARANNFIGAQLSGISPDEAARLIATAPALLDALRRVMRHIPADAGGCSLSDDIRRAREAIAAATGEAA